MAGPGTAASRSVRSNARVEAARTSNACQACRDKKVKCSGQKPCKYCEKRHLTCNFAVTDKRKLFSISHIRQLQNKIALYEGSKDSEALSPPLSATAGQHESEGSDIRAWSTTSPSRGGQTPSQQMSASQQVSSSDVEQTVPTPSEYWGHSLDAPSSSGRGPERRSLPIAPETTLSSTELFSSEVKTLLVSRSNPGSAVSTSTSHPSPIPQIDRRGLDAARFFWPSEEDAYTMLEVVVSNVGISQQMFDTRQFSDNLSILYQDENCNIQLPELWIVEMLLVFAIGRLLQARPDPDGLLPGTTHFQEAMRRMPAMMDLRKHGILGIEVAGLTGMYLQIIDRKDDAYLHANMALRFAIGNGYHRAGDKSTRQRSANVHRNRLWWTLYMQERRLCAAGGWPLSIGDYAITAVPPYDAAGYSTSTPMAINVRIARVTGQITATIYAQKDESEGTFISNVQKILRSLHDIEKEMPSELSMNFESGLFIAGLPFSDTNPTTARTSATLYISVFSAVIHTVRPILLYMARNSRDHEHDTPSHEVSPALRRLAEICVEAASKMLVILQELRKKEILAKHAFLDLDATFTIGFIFVLVEAINPGKGLGHDGIEGSRAVLGYQVRLGNRAAARRLEELDQMCASLSLTVKHHPLTATPIAQTSRGQATFTQPFSFETGYGLVDDHMPSDVGAQTEKQSFGVGTDPVMINNLDFQGADLSSIPLEGDDSLYFVYHNSYMPFTGVEQTDWEALESQLL